jgi:hypothetical protein
LRADLISDDIPLAAPGTLIEGRAERADAYPVVVTANAETAYRSIADLVVRELTEVRVSQEASGRLVLSFGLPAPADGPGAAAGASR